MITQPTNITPVVPPSEISCLEKCLILQKDHFDHLYFAFYLFNCSLVFLEEKKEPFKNNNIPITFNYSLAFSVERKTSHFMFSLCLNRACYA